MGLTVFLTPAAICLTALSLYWLAQGARYRDRRKVISALVLFALLTAGCSVLMEFITRPL